MFLTIFIGTYNRCEALGASPYGFEKTLPFFIGHNYLRQGTEIRIFACGNKGTSFKRCHFTVANTHGTVRTGCGLPYRIGTWCVLAVLILALAGCGAGGETGASGYWGGGSAGSTTGPGYSVAGNFKDAVSGEPLADAVCTLTPLSKGGILMDFIRAVNPRSPITTSTDSRGEYTFTAVPSGTYSLQITKMGYVTAAVNSLTVAADISGLSHSSPQVSQWTTLTGVSHPYDSAKSYMIVTAQAPAKAAGPSAGISAIISPGDGVQIGYMTDGTPSVVDWNATSTYANGQVFFGNLTPGARYVITFIYLGQAYNVSVQGGAPQAFVVSLDSAGSLSAVTVTLTTTVQPTPSPSPSESPSPSPTPSPSPSPLPSPVPSPSPSPDPGGGGGGGGGTPTYTVTYDGNGSSGGTVPSVVYYPQGGTVTVSGNTGTLVKAGSVFAGWNTLADGTGTSYAAAATFTMGAANVTLYAKWSNPYTVTYDANGGSGSVPVDATIYPQGGTVTVLGNTGPVAYTGYTFAGWNTLADGTGTTYAAAATFTMGAANVTLYAKWTGTYVYVANYNGNNNNTLTGFRIDPVDGSLTQIAVPWALGTNNNSAITKDPSGSFVYVSTDDGIKGFSVGALGVLTSIASTWGTDAKTAMTMASPGSYLYAADSNKKIRGYNIHSSTGVLSEFIPGGWATTNTINYGMAMDPLGKYVYGVSANPSALQGFTRDGASGVLAEMTPNSPWTIGSGENHNPVITPDGKFLYMVDHAGGIIHCYSIGGNGLLNHESNTLQSETNYPSEMTIDTSGTNLYASDYGIGGAHGTTITHFKINSTNGTLTKQLATTIPNLGSRPMQLAIDPSGRFLYVACFGTDTIAGLSIGAGGALTGIGSWSTVEANPQ